MGKEKKIESGMGEVPFQLCEIFIYSPASFLPHPDLQPSLPLPLFTFVSHSMDLSKLPSQPFSKLPKVFPQPYPISFPAEH
jgi:hypothetical protein